LEHQIKDGHPFMHGPLVIKEAQDCCRRFTGDGREAETRSDPNGFVCCLPRGEFYDRQAASPLQEIGLTNTFTP